MSTPHFVVQRVGDQYELVRENHTETFDYRLYAVGGSLLVVYGLIRRGYVGLAIAILGAGYAYRGVTGRDPLRWLQDRFLARETNGRSNLAPSYAHDIPRARQMPGDEVEEASMESFPASDAPAHTKAATTPEQP